MSKTENQVEKKHHWLFAAQVVFANQAPKPGEEPGGVIVLNGLLLTDEKLIKVQDLARAQMAAINNFKQRMQNEALEVVDVVFLSGFSHLGYMSAPEYSAQPEGQALVATDVPVDHNRKTGHLKVAATDGVAVESENQGG